jgi:hypothetical protein
MCNTFYEQSDTMPLHRVAENIVAKTNLMKVNVNNLPATVVIYLQK